MASKKKSSTTVGTRGDSVPGRAPKSPTTPAFLLKLWLLVDNKNTDKYIRWGEDGNSFIISDKAMFARAVLPRVYKHSRIESFIRQLHMYRFKKKFTSQDGAGKINQNHLEFQHPHFLKGKRSQLQLITRNGNKNKDNVISHSEAKERFQRNRSSQTVSKDVMENDQEVKDDGSVFEELTMSSAIEASQQVTGWPTPPLSTQPNGGLLADRRHPSTVPQAVSKKRATKRTTSPGRAKAPPQKSQSYEDRMVELAEEQHRLTLQHMQLEHEQRIKVLAVQKLTEQKKLEAVMATLSKKLSECSSLSCP